MNVTLVNLATEFGHQAATRLATAYEGAILTVSLGQLSRMPDRNTRLAMVEAMIAEGRRNGFATNGLTEVAIAAANACSTPGTAAILQDRACQP